MGVMLSKSETALNTTTTRLIQQHGSEHMTSRKGVWVTISYVIAYITMGRF